MYIWGLSWLFLRLEFVVETGANTDFVLNLVPCIPTSIGKRSGYRLVSFSLCWLIFQVTLSYHIPYMFVKDRDGTIIGKNMFPNFVIDVFAQ